MSRLEFDALIEERLFLAGRTAEDVDVVLERLYPKSTSEAVAELRERGLVLRHS